MTIQELINASLRAIQVLQAGESPSTDASTDAAAALDRLLSSWSADGLNVHTLIKEQLSLIANQQSYTWGSGGDFNSARPTRIKPDGAAILIGGLRYRIEVLERAEQWQQIVEEAAAAEAPVQLYCDYAYPLSTVRLWPKPKCTAATKLDVMSLKDLRSIMGADAAVSISTVSKAAAAVVTSTAHGFAIGTTPQVTIAGATGTGWTGINATWTATVLTADTFSIPADSTGFGTLGGTITFTSPVLRLNVSVLNFPGQYYRALVSALAFELAPEYGRTVSPELAASAAEARATVRTLNAKNGIDQPEAQAPQAAQA